MWHRRNHLSYNTSALTTGGGLVFVGDIAGHFYALDAMTGDQLWDAATEPAADGFPITYAVRGRQYVAVPSGAGWSLAWTHIHDVFPEAQRPPGGPSRMRVFALP